MQVFIIKIAFRSCSNEKYNMFVLDFNNDSQYWLKLITNVCYTIEF